MKQLFFFFKKKIIFLQLKLFIVRNDGGYNMYKVLFACATRNLVINNDFFRSKKNSFQIICILSIDGLLEINAHVKEIFFLALGLW